MKIVKSPQPSSVRDALYVLRTQGESFIEIDYELDPYLGIANHYRTSFATSPAGSRTGDEPVVLYKAAGFDIPVLMGLFGSRRRNEWLMGAEPKRGARRFARQLSFPIPPVWTTNPSCQEREAKQFLAALPILTTTAMDAGPFLTSGVICAGDPDEGFVSVSIHRMRVLDDKHLTVWMLPGRDLQRLYQTATDARRTLPISINIGAPPVVYITSSLSAPFVRPGAGEIEAAGALLGSPIEIARCATNDTFCLAQSEIVIEGEILLETAAEYSDPSTSLGMPEFLGYMGRAQACLPVIEISGVFLRHGAVYQTFLGPGKEQSELLALPTEAGMLVDLNHVMAGDLDVLDAHYLAAGGGQLVLALRVHKRRDRAGSMEQLRDAITERHGLTKAVWVVDEDVDIHSSEDLLWASATRFQPSRDIYVRTGLPGFPLDPSQAPSYLEATYPSTNKYLFDLTVPVKLRPSFKRI